MNQAQEAAYLYNQLKPSALHAYRNNILTRTPARLQEEMPDVIDNDIAAMMSAAVAPVNVDPPNASQTDATHLHCTLGNWNGVPTSRTYQWYKDTVLINGATAADLTITSADYGHNFNCVQTATNGAGTSPPITTNTVTPQAAPPLT